MDRSKFPRHSSIRIGSEREGGTRGRNTLPVGGRNGKQGNYSIVRHSLGNCDANDAAILQREPEGLRPGLG